MIFAKRFTYDVWQGSEYASAIYTTISIRALPIRSAGLFKFEFKYYLLISKFKFKFKYYLFIQIY